MGHGFYPPIAIHITLWWIVDDPISGYFVIDIFSVVDALLQQNWGDETTSIITVKDDLYEPYCFFLTIMFPLHYATCE